MLGWSSEDSLHRNAVIFYCRTDSSILACVRPMALQASKAGTGSRPRLRYSNVNDSISGCMVAKILLFESSSSFDEEGYFANSS